MLPFGLLGKKVSMTQIFDEEGNVIPITIIKSNPGVITAIKTKEKHGYNAIQIGYVKVNDKKLTKPELGHLKNKNLESFKYLKEFKISNVEDFSIGQILNFTNSLSGTFIDITGYSIGKGFAGNQKRNNFRRGPMTHGSKNHRAPGSIGACATPSRVFPGKKMAGHLGNVQTTVSNLKVIKFDEIENLILVKGSIPGKTGNLVLVKPAKKL